MITHGNFVTLDAKARPPAQVYSPDATAHEAWRRTKASRELEGEIVGVAREHFPAIGKLSSNQFDRSSYTFWGIQGRRRHNNPLRFTGGSQSEVFTFEMHDRSWSCWGDRRRPHCWMRRKSWTICGNAAFAAGHTRLELLSRVAAGLPLEPHEGAVEMIWETVEG